jgi:hypothetical protein
MFVSKTIYNKPYTTNQKPKKKIKLKEERNKIHEIKNKLNGNKQREKYLQKNLGFQFSTLDHSQFLQEGMQEGNIRFFNNNNTLIAIVRKGKGSVKNLVPKIEK